LMRVFGLSHFLVQQENKRMCRLWMYSNIWV
jgi:hypothetical protein